MIVLQDGQKIDVRTKATMRNHQGRSEPTAQQSARISGTTPSGCADAPPYEIKIKPHTSAFSEIGGLLRQLPSLGVEGGRSEVVVVLQDGQKTEVRTKAAKTKSPRSSKPPAQQPTRNSGTTPSGCADAPPRKKPRSKSKNGKTYSNGRSRREELVIVLP